MYLSAEGVETHHHWHDNLSRSESSFSCPKPVYLKYPAWNTYLGSKERRGGALLYIFLPPTLATEDRNTREIQHLEWNIHSTALKTVCISSTPPLSGASVISLRRIIFILHSQSLKPSNMVRTTGIWSQMTFKNQFLIFFRANMYISLSRHV